MLFRSQYIFSKTNNPKALVLTRQNIDYLETNASYEDFKKGYYELVPGTDATIFASGSEVNLAIEVSELLKDKSIQIISTPILNKLNPDLIRSLGINNKVFTIELGRSIGWQDYVGPVTKSFSIDSFGASAPINQLENNFKIGRAHV